MIFLAIQVPQLLVTVILLWQCISNANALHCFVCDSTINPGCTDLKSNSSIVPEECSLKTMKSIDSWLFDLNKIEYFAMGPYNIPVMLCQKVVTKAPNRNALITARFCQIQLADSDPCVVLRNKLKSSPTYNNPSGIALQSSAQHDGNGNDNKKNFDNKEDEFFCSYCNENFCNGSSILNKSTNCIVIVVISIMLIATALHKRNFW